MAGTAEREGKIAAFAERSAGLPPMVREAMIFVYGAVVCPFVDFFARFGWLALALLAFIGLFRLSDIAMGVMANPFYIDMGFSLQQIANITKIYRLRDVDLGRAAGRRAGVSPGRTAPAGALGLPDRRQQPPFSWLAIIGQPDATCWAWRSASTIS